MKSKDNSRTPNLGSRRVDKEDHNAPLGAGMGPSVVKKAVEEALGVAESVALTSTATPVQSPRLTPTLNLNVSLREIVEQVEEFLAPEIGAELRANPKDEEDLDELEIEADIGRPASIESFDRPPESVAGKKDWASEPTREMETPLTHLDTAALEGQERHEAPSVEDDSVSPGASLRDSMVDAAMDSVLLPTDGAAEDSMVQGDAAERPAFREPQSTNGVHEERRQVSSWVPDETKTGISGWYSDPEVMRYRLQDKLAIYLEGSYFEILELPVDATRDEIEDSYRLLTRQFDPSHYASLGLADLAEGIDAVQSSLTEAYEVLADDRVREEYRKALVSAG